MIRGGELATATPRNKKKRLPREKLKGFRTEREEEGGGNEKKRKASPGASFIHFFIIQL